MRKSASEAEATIARRLEVAVETEKEVEAVKGDEAVTEFGVEAETAAMGVLAAKDLVVESLHSIGTFLLQALSTSRQCSIKLCKRLDRYYKFNKYFISKNICNCMVSVCFKLFK